MVVCELQIIVNQKTSTKRLLRLRAFDAADPSESRLQFMQPRGPRLIIELLHDHALEACHLGSSDSPQPVPLEVGQSRVCLIASPYRPDKICTASLRVQMLDGLEKAVFSPRLHRPEEVCQIDVCTRQGHE